jgi:hypothetical protein
MYAMRRVMKRWSFWTALIAALLYLGTAQAQTQLPVSAIEAETPPPDNLLTNITQLANGFSRTDLFYMPWSSWRWNLFPTGGQPWWIDFSQLPWIETARATSPGGVFEGIKAVSINLSLELCSGELVVWSHSDGKELARFAPPKEYQPGQWPAESGAVARLWKQWQEAQSNKEWEEFYGPLEAPVLVLFAELADLREWPEYMKNLLAAEEAARLEAESKNQQPEGPVKSERGMAMMMGDPCTITNEAEPFKVLEIVGDTNGWMTVTWESCSDHLYEVLTTEDLCSQPWTNQLVMLGEDAMTSWVDTNAPSFTNRFYKVCRLTFTGDEDDDGLGNLDELTAGADLHNPDTDGDGMPDGWEVAYSFDATDPADAGEDADADGSSNLDEYLGESDPRNFVSVPPNNPVRLALNGFNYVQLNLLHAVAGLGEITWDHTLDNTGRRNQIRGKLEEVLVNCLDIVVNPEGVLAETNIVVTWTLTNVLAATGNNTGTWKTGTPSSIQVEELTAVLNKLTYVATQSVTYTGVANTFMGTNCSASVVTNIVFSYPAMWPTNWTIKSSIQFEAKGGYNGSVADDYVDFAGAQIPPQTTSCPSLDTSYTHLLPSYSPTGTNTLTLTDNCACGFDSNHVYLANYHVVHVLKVPAVEVKFDAPICNGFDDWTGFLSPINSDHDLRIWLSVPQASNNTVTAATTPDTLAPWITFDTDNTGIASVSPTTAASTSSILTIDAVASPDITNTLVNVKFKDVKLASFHADTLPIKTGITVGLYYVTDSNDPATAPTNTASNTDLQTRFNDIYGKQANIFFTVGTEISTNISYDTDLINGWLDVINNTFWKEMAEIKNQLLNNNNINVYHVKHIRSRVDSTITYGGVAPYNGLHCYISDVHTGSPPYIAAHELGHALGGLNHARRNTGIMFQQALTNEPCQVFRNEWREMNKQARQLP